MSIEIPPAGLHAVVTVLGEPYYSEVKKIWQDLEQACGVKGVWVSAVPHFSWIGMTGFDEGCLDEGLRELAAEAQPFMVQTSSLGIFSGEKPVVYISLAKDETLMRFHDRVWQRLEKCLHGVNHYYSPPLWTPHITLAIGDVERANIACVIERLAFRGWDWTFLVDRIGIISLPAEMTIRSEMNYLFGG
ncbi:MAG: 2'-5' RNA ligase family protein [Anaerolineales bacterium]|nr:2'-5' RNA ligase family protein [Anaerolineales bacterium]